MNQIYHKKKNIVTTNWNKAINNKPIYHENKL